MVVAFRKREGLVLSESDVLRQVDDRVIVIANAYDHGFATCWPAGSRLILDAFDNAWRHSRNLTSAFEEARALFVTRAREILGEPDELVGGPGASLLVASITREQVQVVWIGDAWLVLFDGSRPLARTEPHTVGALMRAQGFDAREQPHRRVLTRTIDDRSHEPPATVTFDVRASRVLVMSGEGDDPSFVEDPREHAEAGLAALHKEAFAAAVVFQTTGKF